MLCPTHIQAELGMRVPLVQSTGIHLWLRGAAEGQKVGLSRKKTQHSSFLLSLLLPALTIF
jgi:hypothetical protein